MKHVGLPVLSDFPRVSYAEWRTLAERDLKGVPFEKRLVTELYEGLRVQPLYLRETGCWAGSEPGWPGDAPFTRGSKPLGNYGGWHVMQAYAHPSPEQAAQDIQLELGRGVSALWLQVHDPAGKSPNGVRLDTAEAWDRVLGAAGGDVLLAVDAGHSFLASAAELIRSWDERKLASDQVRGAFNADPLGALAASGQSPSTPERQLADLADLARYTAERYPGVTAVRVSSQPYSDAGASAVQELAAALSTGVAYLRALERGGLTPSAACAQLVFTYAVGTDQFLEIAKLRAARRLWHQVLTACGVAPDAQRMTLHAVTASRVLTQRDPWVNLLRGTVSCFAAAVGSADWVTVEPFDAALGLPDDLARRIARNTQIILQEEAHLAKVADPAGGSWYVETLTEQLAEKAWSSFQELERRGGMLAVLRDGSWAKEIAAVASERAKNIARRKDPITGVSEFPNGKEPRLSRPRPEAVAAELPASSPPSRGEVVAALRELAGAAEGRRTPAAVEAARAGATLEQIGSACRDGKPEPVAPLPRNRYAAGYEALRDGSDAHLERTGQRPKVFLANLGAIAQHGARATYSQNFFEAGGFAAVTNDGFPDAAALAAAFTQSGARLAVICGSDAQYEQLAAPTARALAAAGAKEIVLAGRPADKDKEAAYREGGVTRFIFLGCDVLGTLSALWQDQQVVS